MVSESQTDESNNDYMIWVVKPRKTWDLIDIDETVLARVTKVSEGFAWGLIAYPNDNSAGYRDTLDEAKEVARRLVEIQRDAREIVRLLDEYQKNRPA